MPNTDTVGMAIKYAKSQLEAPIFNHVMRSWLFATRVGQIRGLQASSTPQVTLRAAEVTTALAVAVTDCRQQQQPPDRFALDATKPDFPR